MKVILVIAICLWGLTPGFGEKAELIDGLMDAHILDRQIIEDNEITATNGHDASRHDVPFISYMNPLNDPVVMKEWNILADIFQERNIRLGMTICSMRCSTTIDSRDLSKGHIIVKEVIHEGVINNTILRLELRNAPNQSMEATRDTRAGDFEHD